MYAITVWQPWADAIADGRKPVENRVWAAPPVPPVGEDWPDPHVPAGSRPRGAIIAAARLAGCHHYTKCPMCSRWAAAGQYHWQLDQVQALAEPVRTRGYQRLWRLRPDVEQAVATAVQDAREAADDAMWWDTLTGMDAAGMLAEGGE